MRTKKATNNKREVKMEMGEGCSNGLPGFETIVQVA